MDESNEFIPNRIAILPTPTKKVDADVERVKSAFKATLNNVVVEPVKAAASRVKDNVDFYAKGANPLIKTTESKGPFGPGVKNEPS